MISLCLAIETSCDDTSVALVEADGVVRGLLSANQDLAHAPFGGIVPEVACRQHLENLLPLIEKLFETTGCPKDQVQGIVVTSRPGLIGSLIVGIVTAKTLSQVYGWPLIGVNHLEGHLVAPFLRDAQVTPSWGMEQAFLSMAVSGGHSTLYLVHEFGKYEVLGSTLDDAAGEAFDKFGKMVGLGFPGGAAVDRLAKSGNRKAYDFPRSMIRENHFMMSFSGLKASAQRLVESMSPEEIQKHRDDLCASFQEAIVDVLIAKLERAREKTGIQRATITGGVSANSRLRERAQEWAASRHVQLQIPPLRFCTDNAAMIGYAGILRLNRGERNGLDLGPSPQSLQGDFFGEDNR